jgi:putative heme-binding domain-containing protein
MKPVTHSPARPTALGAVALWAACLASGGAGSPLVAPSEPRSPEEQREAFRLPPGYEIQLVAAEPMIHKPMNMAFDERGRLWVTHSREYPHPAGASGSATPRDALTILADFDADGRARTATVFADGLDIPIGVLPLPGGREAIVWSIPHIWKLTDTDGDGRADRREVLYGPFDFVDTHGNQNAFRLGPDGWIYACHGFRNTSRVKLRGTGAVVLEMHSGNTYRFRPDGSAIERVTSGQVNPFGMAFDVRGNQFTADCHSRPLTMLLRGGSYESFGRPHDGLGFAPEATADDHGSTGIAGLAIYEADQFPADVRGSVFLGNVVTNTVHRDRLEWRGSSPWVASREEFLTCDDWWFRPVDLQVGPEGGLYIADFYNCIIGHYEVDLAHPRRDRDRGRIWRVVWTGAPAAPPRPPANLATADLDGLIARLADANAGVARRGLEQLLARQADPPDTAARLTQLALAAPAADRVPPPAPGPDFARSLAVHGLARLGGLDAEVAATLARDPSPLVRVHLVKAIAPLQEADWAARLAREALADPDPFVRRAAAEAVAVAPTGDAIPPLLAAWAAAADDDVQLRHAVRIALRDRLRRADPEAVMALPVSEADRLRLVEVAVAIPDPAVAAVAMRLGRTVSLPEPLRGQCLSGVTRHCGDDLVTEVVTAERDVCVAEPAAAQAARYRPLWEGAVRGGRVAAAANEAVAAWGTALAADLLADPATAEPADVALALDIAARLELGRLAPAALRAAADPRVSPEARGRAVEAAFALEPGAAVGPLGGVLLDGGEPLAVREAVARQLGRDGSALAVDLLTAALTTAPAPLQQPLAAELAARKESAEQLLALIAAGKASARLLGDRQVLERLTASGVPDLERRQTELTAGLPPADEEVAARIARVAAAHAAVADRASAAAEGGVIFRRQCGGCHRVAGEGAVVGPQLDGVAQRGAARLLEDILDPSRNVDEAFRTTVVTTHDGRVHSGLVLREEGEALVLLDASAREFRVPVADVAERTVSRLSPMPGNVVDQIGEDGLVSLLAWLLAPRP